MMQYSHGYAHIDEWDNPMSLLLSNQWIKSEILYSTKELLYLLATHECMWTKISFTANKTPLTETSLAMWSISHGNKNEFLWRLITSRIGKTSTGVSLTISLIILSHYNIFMCINWKDMQIPVWLTTLSWKRWNNRGRVGSVSIVLPKQSWWNSSRYFFFCAAPILAMVSLSCEQTGIHTSTSIAQCCLALSFRQIPAFLKYSYGMEPFAYKEY